MTAKQAVRKQPLKSVRKKRGRSLCPTAEPPDYDAEEVEFIKAIDKFKRENRRPFPAWSEVLAVLRSLGWKKEKRDDGA